MSQSRVPSTRTMLVLALVVTVLMGQLATATTETQPRTVKAVLDLIFDVGKDYYFEGNRGFTNDQSIYDCPLCDSSVYSYCSGKLLHDACCCLNPYEHNLPTQCRYADCSFLHANTCREHKLITACCCSRQHYFRE